MRFEGEQCIGAYRAMLLFKRLFKNEDESSIIDLVCVWEEKRNVDMRQAGRKEGLTVENCKMGAGRAKYPEDDAAGQSRFRDPTKSFTYHLAELCCFI